MASSRSSSGAGRKHEWNSAESYEIAHENVLNSHPLIEEHTVEIARFTYEGEAYIEIAGEVRCRNGVVLAVEKYAETEVRGRRNPRLWARTFSFRYNAHIPGEGTVLRYDNGHGDDFDEYHVHPFDPRAGRAGNAQRIMREEMPHLSEVLDELRELFGLGPGSN